MNALYLQVIFSRIVLVGPALFFPKCAIFLMYRQFFAVQRSMQVATWIGLVATLLIYFPSIPLTAVYGAPKPGNSWEEQLRVLAAGGSTLVYFGIVQGSCSVALDLYIFILPVPSLCNLHLTWKKKLQLLALFATAFL
jgi:hypothetical protein